MKVAMIKNKVLIKNVKKQAKKHKFTTTEFYTESGVFITKQEVEPIKRKLIVAY